MGDPHGYVLFARVFLGALFVIGYVLGCTAAGLLWH